ncbi:hypothetical protein [Actinomadura fibrosa]|uniref:hypothetical protein n=1 Tax=Actinomadura fibrosa TaxID=111802 RepID=UPI001041AA05|nr:hypothetical protein [Actinomadura fibrosa]
MTDPLTFARGGLTVEVEVAGTGREREITGRLVPPSPVIVEVRHAEVAAGGAVGRTDGSGFFCLPRVPAGLVSLVLRFEGGTPVVTSWVRL